MTINQSAQTEAEAEAKKAAKAEARIKAISAIDEGVGKVLSEHIADLVHATDDVTDLLCSLAKIFLIAPTPLLMAMSVKQTSTIRDHLITFHNAINIAMIDAMTCGDPGLDKVLRDSSEVR